MQIYVPDSRSDDFNQMQRVIKYMIIIVVRAFCIDIQIYKFIEHFNLTKVEIENKTEITVSQVTHRDMKTPL